MIGAAANAEITPCMSAKNWRGERGGQSLNLRIASGRTYRDHVGDDVAYREKHRRDRQVDERRLGPGGVDRRLGQELVRLVGQRLVGDHVRDYDVDAHENRAHRSQRILRERIQYESVHIRSAVRVSQQGREEVHAGHDDLADPKRERKLLWVLHLAGHLVELGLPLERKDDVRNVGITRKE